METTNKNLGFSADATDIDLQYFADDNLENTEANDINGDELGRTHFRNYRHPITKVIKRRPPIFPDSHNLTAKALFEKRAQMLPPTVKKKILNKQLTVSDKAYFSARLITGDHVEMFLSSDAEKKGIINLNRAMLPADTTMLLTSIILLSAPSKRNNTTIPIEEADFNMIRSEIANGWFSMRVGQQTFFEKISCEIFKHQANSNLLTGEYKLETPKMILPQQEIEFNLDLGQIPQNTYIKVILKGVETIKA